MRDCREFVLKEFEFKISQQQHEGDVISAQFFIKKN